MTLLPPLQYDAAASAKTAQGTAKFRSTTSGRKFLEVEYDTVGIIVDIIGRDVEKGIEDACKAEIFQVRSALIGLGEILAAQLSDEGQAPRVYRTFQCVDKRDWSFDRHSFHVRGTRTAIKEELDCSRGASNSKLVRETIRLMVQQREQDIRTLYERIRSDAIQTR